MFFDFFNRQRYLDFGKLQDEIIAVPLCPTGVDAKSLPADCHETAETPDVLYEKLNQWGIETQSCDLLDEEAVARLPDAANVISMSGFKFGATENPCTVLGGLLASWSA